MPNGSKDFDEFFRGEFILLVAHLRRLGHQLEESRDAAAEAMFCALRSWGHLESPHAWVRVAAQRIVLRERKQQRKTAERAIEAGLAAQESGPDLSEEVTGRLRVVALLASLPSKQREVMGWYLDGFETHEIAKNLGIAEATVRSTKRHARKLLKKHLERSLRRRPGEEERGYGS